MSIVRIYRGLNGENESVIVVAGEIDELLQKSVEYYAGTPIGQPEVGTVMTPIAEVSGLIFKPADMVEKVFKYVEAIEIDPEAERINDLISKRGLPIIHESAEECVLKADKADEEDVEERTVFAPALEPNDGKGGAPADPDKQDEIYSAEAIRKTAHYWMEHGGVVGLMHKFDVSDQVSVLETYLAPVDFTFENGKKKYNVRKGTWLVRLRIHNDDMWDAIKKGEFGAFSVGGSAIKRTEEIAVDG